MLGNDGRHLEETPKVDIFRWQLLYWSTMCSKQVFPCGNILGFSNIKLSHEIARFALKCGLYDTAVRHFCSWLIQFNRSYKYNGKIARTGISTLNGHISKPVALREKFKKIKCNYFRFCLFNFFLHVFATEPRPPLTAVMIMT